MALQTSYSNQSAAFAGQLADDGPVDVLPMVNDEASASMTFGRAVIRGSATDEFSAILPSSENDVVVGIVIRKHSYSSDQLDDDGVSVLAGEDIAVLRKGRIWAVCEDGCSVGDRLWVRAVAGGDPEFLGGLNNADDGSDMIDCTAQGEWLTSASAGGLAVLEVNFFIL